MILFLVGATAVIVVIVIAAVLSRRLRPAEPRHRYHGRSHRTRATPLDESVDEEGWGYEPVTDLLDMERPPEIACEPEPKPEIAHDEDPGDDTVLLAAPVLEAPPAEDPTLVPLAPAPPPDGHAHADGGVLMPVTAPGILTAAVLASVVQEAADQRAEQQRQQAAREARRRRDIAQWAQAVAGRHDYGDDAGLFPYAEHAPSFELWKSDSFVGALPPILAAEPVTWAPPAELPARRKSLRGRAA